MACLRGGGPDAVVALHRLDEGGGRAEIALDTEGDEALLELRILEDALHRAADLRDEGRRVPAVIPVDLFGKCVDYDAIAAVTSGAGALLLSDAAESLGATYAGRAAGSFGDAAVVSFNGNKIMTTSGGGMLLTHCRALAETLLAPGRPTNARIRRCIRYRPVPLPTRARTTCWPPCPPMCRAVSFPTWNWRSCPCAR